MKTPRCTETGEGASGLKGARGQRTPVRGKARRGRILGVCNRGLHAVRGATQPRGMHRRSNAAGTFATGSRQVRPTVFV